MESNQTINIVTIGNGGGGKSALGNRLLHLTDENKFQEGEEADSVTMTTTGKSGKWYDTETLVVDTPGLNDAEGYDAPHIKEMVNFVETKLSSGIHAILIVVNGQDPRFNESLKRMVMLYRNMYKNKEFWSHIALVFTRCYVQIPMNQSLKRRSFQEKMQKLYQECYPGDLNVPVIPCYFVDSHDYTDPQTEAEFRFMYGWVLSNTPMSNKGLQIPDINFVEETNKERQKIIFQEKIQVGTQRIKVGTHTEIWKSGKIMKGFKKRVDVEDFADVPIMKTKKIEVTEGATEGKLPNGSWVIKQDWKEISRREIIE